MKRSHHGRERALGARKGAFSLIEVLVAAAVLSMLLVLMFQIVNGILQSTNTQNQQMEAVAGARRVLDVLSADLQHAVVGEDTAILVGSTAENPTNLAFLTTRRGPSRSTGHRFLAVSYATNGSNQIIRNYDTVDFQKKGLLDATTNVLSNSILASGILAFQARAVTDNTNYGFTNAPEPNWASTNTDDSGLPSYNGHSGVPGFNVLITGSPNFASGFTNKTHAIEVWIASVDEKDFSILTNSGKLANLQGVFSGDPAGWREIVDAADIPGKVKSGIRILNKTIPVP